MSSARRYNMAIPPVSGSEQNQTGCYSLSSSSRRTPYA